MINGWSKSNKDHLLFRCEAMQKHSGFKESSGPGQLYSAAKSFEQSSRERGKKRRDPSRHDMHHNM
jgi:hypothetical protein